MPTLQAESVGEQNAVEGVAVDWYTVSRLCSETGYVNIVGSLVISKYPYLSSCRHRALKGVNAPHQVVVPHRSANLNC